MPGKEQRKSRVLGLPLEAGRFDDISGAVFRAALMREGSHVCVANVHMFTLAHRTPALAEVLERARFVVSDGMPLVWTLRRKGARHAERIYGPGLMDDLCARAADSGLGVYLYGGIEATLDRLRSVLLDRYPRLQIVGAEAPPMLPERPALDEAAAARIKESGAQLVFVGLGCPKQEYWMDTHAKEIGSLCVGVGAAFDFIAGTLPQAPKWMREAGLEWFFRMISEPRRLFKRYLVSNSAFVYYLLRGRL